MRDAAIKFGKSLKTNAKSSFLSFVRDQDLSRWHEALCLQQASSPSFRALTSWIIVSVLVTAFAGALVASGVATMGSVAAVGFSGLASLYFGYLECLKLIECTCDGRRT
jgi:hypothetical protein